jgi:phosphotransferase system enzyme I (PtsP)
MLKELRKLVQQVNGASSLDEALGIIVGGVKSAVDADACSVWLFDKQQQKLVLMATDGLSKSLEKQLKIRIDQGLVGLVAEREEPINLTNAREHRRYLQVDSLQEDELSSYLGAPIIHAGKRLGVIVVQDNEDNAFDEEDESIVITASAQLAGVLAIAEASGELSPESYFSTTKEQIYAGLASSSGVAIGTAIVLSSDESFSSVETRKVDDIDAEVARFARAQSQLKDDLSSLSANLGDQLSSQELALFDVYARMLDDQATGGEIVKRIQNGFAADTATSQVFSEHVQVFAKMDDDYLRERAADVRDLGLRLLGYLDSRKDEDVEWPDRCVVVARNLVAAHLGQVPRDNIVAVVSTRGSSNSHIAILARGMGLPAVMACEDLPVRTLNNQEVIVDGYRGRVIRYAKPEIRRYYADLIEQAKQVTSELEALKGLPTESRDGVKISLMANVGLATDAIQANEVGADGAGLYRTEIPFLLKEHFPSEGEQTRIYRQQLSAFHPKPVTMRTLDVGGDKSLSYFPIEEANPFLGWRGIRISLDHPELFLTQVRAMIRASEGLNNLKIMLPMIASLDEYERARDLVERAYQEIVEDGLEVQRPPLGVMIEVPSAVYIVDSLARRADFLSVGSNDLVQYLLAVDRNNERVSNVYQSYHPAVIAALERIVTVAREANTPVSLCGELASDPAAAVLLHAMGYRMLSLNSAALLRVKAVLRQLTITEMSEVLMSVRLLERALDIRRAVHAKLIELGVDPLLLNRSSDS